MVKLGVSKDGMCQAPLGRRGAKRIVVEIRSRVKTPMTATIERHPHDAYHVLILLEPAKKRRRILRRKPKKKETLKEMTDNWIANPHDERPLSEVVDEWRKQEGAK